MSTEEAVNLDALSKEELLEHAHSLGISPANAGMTKEELKEAIESAGTDEIAAQSAGNAEGEAVIEEWGAEAVIQGIPQPETPTQTDVEVNEEHGAEALYWEGAYTDGVPPTEPPGGWPGDAVEPAAITDIAPATITLGPPADETLTITGTGFTEASAVTIDGAPAGATYVSETSLTVLIAAGTQPAAAVLSFAVDGSAPFAVTVA